jgi:hypothetical protein
MSAAIEHIPSSGVAVSRLASLQIDEDKKARCVYRARIDEDLQPPRERMTSRSRQSFCDRRSWSCERCSSP